MSPRVVVAGFGSADRRDDGVGPYVAALAASRCAVPDVGPLADPLDLLGQWNRADLVVLVDAVRSGAAPGTVRTFEVDLAGGTPADDVEPAVTSSHGIGLAGVVRLARAVGQSPHRLVIVAVEGERFDLGGELSPAVRAAVPVALARVVELIKEVCPCA